MGMFDFITIEQDGTRWQTKSFDNELREYTITKEGELKREVFYYDHKLNSQGLWRYEKVVIGRETLSDFHGYIYAVAVDDVAMLKDIRIKFTDGKFVDIKEWLEG